MSVDTSRFLLRTVEDGPLEELTLHKKASISAVPASQCSNLKFDLSAIKQSRPAFEQRSTDMNIQSVNAQREATKQQVMQLKAIVEELNSRLSQSSLRESTLGTELSSAHKQLHSERSTYNVRMKAAIDEVDRYQEKEASLKSEVESLVRKLDDNRVSLEEAASSVLNMNKANNTNMLEIKAMKEAIEVMTNSKVDMESRVADTGEKLEASSNALESLTKDNAHLQNVTQVQSVQLEKIKKERDELVEKITDVSQQVVEAERKAEKIKTAVVENSVCSAVKMKDEYEALRLQISELGSACDVEQTEMEELVAKATDIKSKYEKVFGVHEVDHRSEYETATGSLVFGVSPQASLVTSNESQEQRILGSVAEFMADCSFNFGKHSSEPIVTEQISDAQAPIEKHDQEQDMAKAVIQDIKNFLDYTAKYNIVQMQAGEWKVETS